MSKKYSSVIIYTYINPTFRSDSDMSVKHFLHSFLITCDFKLANLFTAHCNTTRNNIIIKQEFNKVAALYRRKF